MTKQKEEISQMNDFREYKAAFDRKNSLMHRNGNEEDPIDRTQLIFDLNELISMEDQGYNSGSQAARMVRNIFSKYRYTDIMDLAKKMSVADVKEFYKEFESIKRRRDSGRNYLNPLPYDKPIGPSKNQKPYKKENNKTSGGSGSGSASEADFRSAMQYYVQLTRNDPTGSLSSNYGTMAKNFIKKFGTDISRWDKNSMNSFVDIVNGLKNKASQNKRISTANARNRGMRRK